MDSDDDQIEELADLPLEQRAAALAELVGRLEARLEATAEEGDGGSDDDPPPA